jgi:hypothetical protein
VVTATTRPYSPKAVIKRARQEILKDVAAGRVPATVQSFAELHDHIDANEYGGGREWPEKEWSTDRFCTFWNHVQDVLDRWIRAGGLHTTC